MNIKVMIAFSNLLFAEGVKKLLESSEDIRVVEISKPGSAPSKTLDSFKPDVILVDFTTLYNGFTEVGQNHDLKLILFDTNCGEVNIISAVITKNLKGVLTGNSEPPVLKKAVRAVSEGELWLDKVSVKNLLAGMHALKKNTRPALSAREWEIVSLVGQGYRNKEIAEKLCVSEPTVKTHLQRIFHKLDIQNRPQLITFAVKNRGESNQNFM